MSYDSNAENEAYDKGFAHGEESGRWNEQERIFEAVNKWLTEPMEAESSNLLDIIRGEATE